MCIKGQVRFYSLLLTSLFILKIFGSVVINVFDSRCVFGFASGSKWTAQTLLVIDSL